MKKLEHWVLMIMFLMMVFISASVMIFAFCNHRMAILMLEDTLCDIAENPTLTSPAKPREISSEGKAYIAELKSQSKAIMDSNTVSFLFQVLLLCIVTVAAYLLFRSYDALKIAQMNLDEAQEDLEKTEENTREAQGSLKETLATIRPFFEGASSSLAIASHYSNIQQMVAALYGAGHEERDALVSWIRDSFNGLEERLNTAKDKHHGIEPSLYDYFMLDIADKIDKKLGGLPGTQEEREKSGIADLSARSERCLALLRSGKFEEWYTEKIAGLGRSSQE